MAKYGLPTEIWVDVFSNLDYLTLKTGVSATCKYFHAIVTQPCPKMDVALFRDEPTPGVGHEKSSGYALHPFLRKHFELRSGHCENKCSTDEDKSKCRRTGLTLVKKFRLYEDFCSFAETLHGYTLRAYDGDKLFGENPVSPAPRDITFRLVYQGRNRQFFRYSIFNENGVRLGKVSLLMTIETAAVMVQKVWAKKVLQLDEASQRVLAPTILQSHERFEDCFRNEYLRSGNLFTHTKERMARLRNLQA